MGSARRLETVRQLPDLAACLLAMQPRAQVASGDLLPLADTVVQMAECDAQHLGQVLAPLTEQRAANESGPQRPATG